MTRTLLSHVACVVALACAGCSVLDTETLENDKGRGAKAFDPYSASASGSIRMALQMYNGCAFLADGSSVSKGDLNIPYPDACESMNDPFSPPGAPTATFRVLTDTQYFLNQITLMDVVHNFTPPASYNEWRTAADWIRTQSRFKHLDWSNMTIAREEWRPGLNENNWVRETFFNAEWMHAQDDYFDLEVVDKDGQVRATARYSHKDFLGESPYAGHSRVSWEAEFVQPPKSVGDMDVHFDPNAGTIFHSQVKMEWVGSTNPFNGFKIPQGVKGQGFIRLKWSLMPQDPFYIPITFVQPEEKGEGCYTADGTDKPVTCGFGLSPDIKLSAPKNGKGYYESGEVFSMYFAAKDGEGHLLHKKDEFPSYLSALEHVGDNGFFYAAPGAFSLLQDRDSLASYKVVGPLQSLRYPEELSDFTTSPFSAFPGPISPSLEATALINQATPFDFLPGMQQVPWPTRRPVVLKDPKPGTYVALLRVHRQYLGERTSRMKAVTFQIGQAEPTAYPGRVGNCQICHRGVLSMENLRHGLEVDHIEGCKACHSNSGGPLATPIHKIHAYSNKYPMNKADCTVCHLTRESAVRPSFEVCSSCHPSVHGSEYFQTQFSLTAPSRFGNCAQGCHADKVPTNHIVPAN